MLGLAVTSHLYPRLEAERFGAGRLTKIRAQSVSGVSCRAVAERLGVPDKLRASAPAGVGQSAESLVETERVLASVIEAVIGACYLHTGYERTAAAVVEAFQPEITNALSHPVDFKSDAAGAPRAPRGDRRVHGRPRGRAAARPHVRGRRVGRRARRSAAAPGARRSTPSRRPRGSRWRRCIPTTPRPLDEDELMGAADGRCTWLDHAQGLQVLPRPHEARLRARASRSSSGPNGSGKSNITDAVLWAMGEQSPLAVRGQSMRDVIFGGGRGVQARSAAEVEIVIDNGDGAVDLPLGEISILRRLDRSGEGEYRLNGARCRLVDVLEVLSDTGLGKEMHSVVSQGRVESIVTSKPRDRRLLIEEAAGLGKHRKRRRRAQLKLERTQDNLDRALDVEREARSRLRPLKRQAEAAELHERLERQTRRGALGARARPRPRPPRRARRGRGASRPPRAPRARRRRPQLADVAARRREAERGDGRAAASSARRSPSASTARARRASASSCASSARARPPRTCASAPSAARAS